MNHYNYPDGKFVRQPMSQAEMEHMPRSCGNDSSAYDFFEAPTPMVWRDRILIIGLVVIAVIAALVYAFWG